MAPVQMDTNRTTATVGPAHRPPLAAAAAPNDVPIKRGRPSSNRVATAISPTPNPLRVTDAQESMALSTVAARSDDTTGLVGAVGSSSSSPTSSTPGPRPTPSTPTSATPPPLPPQTRDNVRTQTTTTPKSPGSHLLRQLQSNLSPKYMNASPAVRGDSRVSRYGRPQKPKETTDCLANDILAAVLRKSLTEVSASPSPPKKRRSPTTTPTKCSKPTAALAVVGPRSPVAGTSAENPHLVRSSPPVYVSPIEKLIMLNRRAICSASNYQPVAATALAISPATAAPLPDHSRAGESPTIAAATVADQDPARYRKTLSFDEPQRSPGQPAVADVAAVQPQSPSAQRKVVVARVASSGRAPVVMSSSSSSSSNAGGNGQLSALHLSATTPQRRNKILPLAPLFSETETTVTATVKAADVESVLMMEQDIENEITTFTVQKSPEIEQQPSSCEPTTSTADEICPEKAADDIDTQSDGTTANGTASAEFAENAENADITMTVINDDSEWIDREPTVELINSMEEPVNNDDVVPMESPVIPSCGEDVDQTATVPANEAESENTFSADLPESSDIVVHITTQHHLAPAIETEPPANGDAPPAMPIKARHKLDNSSHERCASVDSAKGSSIVTDDDRQSTGTDGAESSANGFSGDGASASTGWRQGQVAWARIGNYPYWPCIVCNAPDGRLLSTTKKNALLHIRFLADNGRRSWVSLSSVVPFVGVEDFERMRSELPSNVKKNDSRHRAFVVSAYQELTWQQGLIEAQILMTFALEHRMRIFERTLSQAMDPSSTSSTSSSGSSTTKRRLSIASQDSSFAQLFDLPRRTSTPSLLNDRSVADDSNNNSTATTVALPPAVPSHRASMSRSPTPESPEYEELSDRIDSLSEEAADNKVHNYLRSITTTATAAPDDTDAAREATNRARLEAFRHDDAFRAFYRHTKEHIFADIAHTNEQHLQHLALKLWLLKGFRNAPSPVNVVAAAAAAAADTRRPKPAKSIASTADAAAVHRKPLATGTRTVRESRHSMRRHSVTLAEPPSPASPQLTQQQHEEAARRAHAERLAIRAQRQAQKDERDAAEMSKYFMREHPKNVLFRGLHKELVCRLCHRPAGAGAAPLRKCRTATCHEHVHSGCAAEMRAGRTVEALGSSETRRRRKTKIVLHVAGDHEETAVVDGCGDADYAAPAPADDGDSDDDNDDDYCPDCWPSRAPVCFVCRTAADGTEMRCTDKLCGRHYHSACLKYWPQYKHAYTSNGAPPQLLCPCHVCHTCISDDPRGKHYHSKSSELTKCVRCPATYHCDSNCIPAGARILTASQLVCPRHRVEIRLPVNADWCFICTKGGQLICCETCPNAFHAECLCVPLPDRYICEECETGRLPLYGECVWAKMATCRWWPAVTVPPGEIPESVLAAKRRPHQFAVRFFGTNDYSWISRGFVFLYQTGDSECSDATPWLVAESAAATAATAAAAGAKSAAKRKGVQMELMYQKALMQAKAWHERHEELHAKHVGRGSRELQPVPYIKCRTNWPVPPVRLADHDEHDEPVCECRETDADPCGASCWNVVLQVECHPGTCGAGKRCQNQRFEGRQYPRLRETCVEGKGWGLVTMEPIAAGAFIIEYVGELINRSEFERRLRVKQELKEEHYYFLTLSRELLIDAGPRGNQSRFVNHSCEPNCETQVWQVRGNQRVGLFAVQDIAANTELTFNYNLESVGELKRRCHCGAKRCAGFIGAKFVEEGQVKKKSNDQAAGKKKKKVAKPAKKKPQPPARNATTTAAHPPEIAAPAAVARRILKRKHESNDSDNDDDIRTETLSAPGRKRSKIDA